MKKSTKEKMIDGLVFAGQPVTIAMLDAIRSGATQTIIPIDLANEIVYAGLQDRSNYGSNACENCTDDGFICEDHQTKVHYTAKDDVSYDYRPVHFVTLKDQSTVCGKGGFISGRENRSEVTCADCLTLTAKYESIFKVKVNQFKVKPSMFAY